MKNPFIILCLLFVAVLIALKVTSRKSEPATQTKPQAKLTEKSSSDAAALHPRAGQVTSVPRFAEPKTTNHSPSVQLPTLEETRAARERWRQELREKDEYKEMFAKEDEWKERSKALAKGITLQEVVAVMGLPTRVESFVETSKEPAEAVAVPTNALSNVTGMAFVYYDPDGKQPSMGGSLRERLSELPFDHLLLNFNDRGKLEFMTWGEAGLGASVSGAVRQSVEQSQNVSPASVEPVTPPKQ